MKSTWVVILVLILMAASFFLGRRFAINSISESEIIDTVIIRDTLYAQVPVPSISYELDDVEIPVPIFLPGVVDTVHDTAYIYLPIERKVYETDLYRAVISGYKPSLDSMTLYTNERVIYKDRIIKESDCRKWGFGVIGGYGLGTRGRFSPYVGVGIFYRIW